MAGHRPFIVLQDQLKLLILLMCWPLPFFPWLLFHCSCTFCCMKRLKSLISDACCGCHSRCSSSSSSWPCCFCWPCRGPGYLQNTACCLPLGTGGWGGKHHYYLLSMLLQTFNMRCMHRLRLLLLLLRLGLLLWYLFLLP